MRRRPASVSTLGKECQWSANKTTTLKHLPMLAASSELPLTSFTATDDPFHSIDVTLPKNPWPRVVLASAAVTGLPAPKPTPTGTGTSPTGVGLSASDVPPRCFIVVASMIHRSGIAVVNSKKSGKRAKRNTRIRASACRAVPTRAS